MNSYRLGPGVRWVVERFAVTVTDGRRTVLTLHYPEAAIWDLLSRGYAFDAVVDLIRHIAAMPAEQAAPLVRTTIDAWRAAGLLEER